MFAVFKMKRQKKHTHFTLFSQLLGLFLALTVLVISGTPENQYTEQNNVNTEQSDDDHSTEGPVIKIDEAVTSSAQFSVAFQSFLIVALPDFVEQRFEGQSIDWLISVNPKKIKVLFRLIISPNAP